MKRLSYIILFLFVFLFLWTLTHVKVSTGESKIPTEESQPAVTDSVTNGALKTSEATTTQPQVSEAQPVDKAGEPQATDTATDQATQAEPAEKLQEKESVSHNLPDYFTTKPPFSEGIYPCSNCHASMEANKERRELFFHTEITLYHAAKQRWCLDCHDPKNRDRLRLANGDLVPFETSYYLCAQCHGNIFRDWKPGIHGKRVGDWNGKKTYYLCVNCHNPHKPQFQALKPLPPPQRPLENADVKETRTIKIEGNNIYIPDYKEKPHDLKEGTHHEP